MSININIKKYNEIKYNNSYLSPEGLSEYKIYKADYSKPLYGYDEVITTDEYGVGYGGEQPFVCDKNIVHENTLFTRIDFPTPAISYSPNAAGAERESFMVYNSFYVDNSYPNIPRIYIDGERYIDQVYSKFEGIFGYIQANLIDDFDFDYGIRMRFNGSFDRSVYSYSQFIRHYSFITEQNAPEFYKRIRTFMYGALIAPRNNMLSVSYKSSVDGRIKPIELSYEDTPFRNTPITIPFYNNIEYLAARCATTPWEGTITQEIKDFINNM